MTTSRNTGPPPRATRFLRWFCNPDLLEDIEGDLHELFEERSQEKGTAFARRKYLIDVILLLRPGIIRTFRQPKNNPLMFGNHLKMAVRHSYKFKSFTLLNLLGLFVGILSSMSIFVWVMDEWKTDRFHSNSENIWMLHRNMYQSSGAINTTPAIPQPMLQVLQTEYPEVERAVIVGWPMELLFRRDEESSMERGRYASEELFRMFSFPLLAGDKNTLLDEMHAVVISEKLKERYFGNASPADVLGKTFTIDNAEEYEITGVFRIPKYSSVEFDWIIPAKDYIADNDWVESWYNGGFSMLMTTAGNADISALRKRIKGEVNRHIENGADERIVMQKFADNYLYGKFEDGKVVGGRIDYLRIMGVIGLLILLIAVINFVNLTTARAGRRSREIGIRKVFGAGRSMIKTQFFTEFFLHVIVAVLLSIGAHYLLLPTLGQLTGKELTHEIFLQPAFWGLIAIFVIVATLLAGGYPALVLSSINVVNSLRGEHRPGSASGMIRKAMAIIQFSIAIFMIVGTLMVSRQLDYILGKDLGLDRENVLVMHLPSELAAKSEVFKNEISQLPGVAGITLASSNPLFHRQSTGSADWDGKDPDVVMEINFLTVDEDFFSTMNTSLVSGRVFSEELKSDSNKYIINEVAARTIGFEDAVGENFSIWGIEGQIIGVVKDYHMSSLYQPIDPLVIRYEPGAGSTALIRLNEDESNTLEAIAGIHRQLAPDFPFRYEFMEEIFRSSYSSEETIRNLVQIFTVISIFLSCLGLFGLSSYSAERRLKEVSIRKLHGAGVVQLLLTLTSDYMVHMLIAMALAFPLAYIFVGNWLDTFAFHTNMSISVFILSALASFVIGLLTVCIKSYQSAVINPIETLKRG